ncbi:hypothetical protein CLIB1423_23S01266 [[Candida] railenensis]|uniref:Uncharacterized protein n=1 Tax=[Candida] railenensis TaxID=45579 RepID=A0A9P0QUV5_9ASCO|nr:hypothetical protein CLIB1423_23S01266 [[Candida] railenensis]
MDTTNHSEQSGNRTVLPHQSYLVGTESNVENGAPLNNNKNHPDEESRKRPKLSEDEGQIAKRTTVLSEKASGKAFPSFNKLPLLELLSEYFPNRRHLGTLVYNPTTTWSTLQSEKLIGIKPEHVEMFIDLKERYIEKLEDKEFLAETKYIPVIPPLPVEYSNSYLEIKIPNRYLKEARESKERSIWGGNGGIYTDDSDVLTVLKHQGLFDGTIDLSVWNDGWTAKDIVRPGAKDIDSDSNSDAESYDVSATLLLLPPLSSYGGYYANGVNPRSWNKSRRKHNGISYVVYDVKWESRGTYLNDKNVFREAILEDLQAGKTVKREMSEKDGWRFNVGYFQELKKKYDSLNGDKQETVPEEKHEVVAEPVAAAPTVPTYTPENQ